MTPAQPDIDVRELCAKLRQRNVLQKGETVMLDIGDGRGAQPVPYGDTVQVRNPDGDEAATALETLEARVKVLEEALDPFAGHANIVEDEAADRLASLLRDALEESSPGALVEITAEAGYATTVDGSFDLSDVALRFLDSIRAPKFK